MNSWLHPYGCVNEYWWWQFRVSTLRVQQSIDCQKEWGTRGGVVVDLQSEVDITEEGPLTRLLGLHSEGKNLE